LRSWLFALLVVASFGPGGSAHAAQASWSSLGTISPPFTNASSPVVAENSSGNAVFAWARRHGPSQCSGLPCSQAEARIRFMPMARLSGWGTFLTDALSDTGQDALGPDVAMASNGEAAFVWERLDGTTQCGDSSCSRIEGRLYSQVSDTYGTVQTLSAAGQNAHAPQVAIAPNGDAVFVWERFDGTTQCGSSCSRIQTRTLSASTGALSAVQTLSAAGQHAHAPQVGVDSTGNAVFAWERSDGTTQCGSSCSRIQTRTRSASTGALSAVQTLSAAGQHAHAPQVAVDPTGDAAFAWERSDGTVQCSGSSCSRIQARFYSATTGTYSGTQTLSAAGQHAHAPQVAIAPNGDAAFAWERFDGTTQCGGAGCARIQAVARSAPTGSLSAVQTLSDPGQHARAPQVGVDAAGNAVFVWERFDGTTQCGGSSCSRVQARTRLATGALTAVITLSLPGQDAFAPALSVDTDGGLDPSRPDALALWSRYDGTRDGACCLRIQAAEQAVVNTTSERFQSRSWEMTRSFDQATVISDFNGDGLDDFLLSRHHFSDEDHTQLQKPDGSFARGFVFPPTDRHGCDAGDVNGDGRVDIYCMHGAQDGNAPAKKNELWIARPDGTYVDEATLWGVTDPYGRGRLPVLFDFNNDGRLDLYITNETDEGPRPDGQRNENILYLNTGTGFVEKPVTATGAFGSTCVDVGDWDGDGFLDLLVCGPQLHLFRNVGGQSTQLQDDLLGPDPVSSPRDAELSDLNGDGRLDLVIVQEKQVHIRLNLGSGARFSQINYSGSLQDGMAVAAGDLTADGRPDLYVVEGFANGRNADDVLFEGPGWARVAVPPAYRGWGSTVELINVSGRPTALVTNGHGTPGSPGSILGPLQFVTLRPAAGSKR
jgi:hypothetical protein